MTTTHTPRRHQYHGKTASYWQAEFAKTDDPDGLDFPIHSYCALMAAVFSGIKTWKYKFVKRNKRTGRVIISTEIEVDYIIEKYAEAGWKATVLDIRGYPYNSKGSGNNSTTVLQRPFYVQTGWKFQHMARALRQVQS